MSKPREFWIEMTEHLAVVHDGDNSVQVGPSYYAIPSQRSWILVSNKPIDNSVHVIDIDAYNNAIKMLEEMAESYKKYAMHIDGCLYFFGSSIEYACDCGLDDVLNKYRKFKEGIK